MPLMLSSMRKKSPKIREHMLSCMSDQIVQMIKDMNSTKAMWDAFENKNGVMSPPRHHAITIKLGQAKCYVTKGIEKHLLMLSDLLETLEKAGHGYTDEQR